MIADDARVEPGATVGDGTYVWHLAHVRDGAEIGDNCVIGGGAFIDANVIIGCNCKIQNAAQVFAPARIGDGVFIGPGAILTNDRAPRAVNEAGEPKTAGGWHAESVIVREGAVSAQGLSSSPGSPSAVGQWSPPELW